MTEMMDRIRDEMAKEPAGSPISVIGEYVTERIQRGARIPEDKTLKGAYKAMEDWARKQSSGKGCVCVPPDRAFAIVDEYFGIASDAKPQAFAAPAKAAAPADDPFDLDALLEGL